MGNVAKLGGLTALLLLSQVLVCTAAENPPAAQPCALQEVNSIGTAIQPTGIIGVPVLVNGKTVLLGLDTGSTGTSISAAEAGALGLQTAMANNGVAFVNNIPMEMYVMLSTFGLGRLQVTDLPVWIAPNRVINSGIAGLLGEDTLRSFDIEIDPAHNKLNLFVPNTCTRDAAYWTHGSVAAIPITINDEGHIEIEAVLDGSPVTLTVDTGSTISFMNIDSAQSLFRWPNNNSRVKTLRNENVNGGDTVSIREFPFASLNLHGLSVANPEIELLPNSSFSAHHRDMFILGMNVLQHLRMYIAYKQGVMYVTDANAN